MPCSRPRHIGFENPLRIVDSGSEAINYLSGLGIYADRAQYPLPHIAVVDTILDGENGFDVLRWIRQQDQFKELVTIRYSGDGGPDEEARARKLGASAYHKKPTSLTDLEALLRRLGDFWLLGGPSATIPQRWRQIRDDFFRSDQRRKVEE